MKSPLEPAKEILREFLRELTLIEKARSRIPLPSLILETSIPPIDPSTQSIATAELYYQKQNAYTWLYGTRRYRPLMQRPQVDLIPDYYRQPARPLYEKWYDFGCGKEVMTRGNIIPHPENCSIGEYLYRLSFAIIEKGENRAVWRLCCINLCEQIPLAGHLRFHAAL